MLQSLPPDVVRVGVYACIAYFLIYWTRYPIFMLPAEISKANVGSIFGTKLAFQEAISFALGLAYFVAKFPAMVVMSSKIYMENRFAMLSFLSITSGLLGSLPLLTGSPLLGVFGVFLAGVPSAWIYGGLMAYFEGRRSTELLLAVFTTTLIFAGGTSRGVAQHLLDMGVEPTGMPALLACGVLPVIIYMYKRLDALPGPSQEDLQSRGKRSASTVAQNFVFARHFAPGIITFIVAYALIFAMRQFRDLFARDLLTAAFGGAPPSPSTLFLGDVGGAALAFALLVHFSRIENNASALQTMVRASCVLTALLGLAALGLRNGFLGPLGWHFWTGVSIYGIFGCCSPAFWDRLMGASGESITCTFLVFFADMVGFIGQLSLLIWKIFGAEEGEETDNNDTLEQYLTLCVILSPVLVAMFLFVSWYFQVALAHKHLPENDTSVHSKDKDLLTIDWGKGRTGDEEAQGAATLDAQRSPREVELSARPRHYVTNSEAKVDSELSTLIGQKEPAGGQHWD